MFEVVGFFTVLIITLVVIYEGLKKLYNHGYTDGYKQSKYDQMLAEQIISDTKGNETRHQVDAMYREMMRIKSEEEAE